MSLDLAKSKDWSEIVKNYLQALAIIVAAIWTYNTFLKKEAPGLESIVNLNSKLDVYSTSNRNVNKFSFDVELKNNGVTSVDISKVKISVWKFKFNVNDVTKPTYVSIEDIEKNGIRLFEKEYPGKEDENDPTVFFPFVQHFSPGSSYHHVYEWLIPRGEDDESICFRIQVYKKQKDKRPTWQAYSWDKLN